MTEELLFLPATRAASLIRARRLSPVEYVDAVLAAAHASQPRINAFVTITDEMARAAARRAEDAVMRGDPLGKLHGVPVHIKDLYATKGVRTSYGSAIHEHNVPDEDDVLVKRLTEAGAIVVGKTTTPEFGHKGLTDGPAFGITRNPWHLDRTSGGSSGGAAAAVAAGVAPLGLGSDGAGSVRIPAACCGLVGLKPTQGVVPGMSTADGFGTNMTAGPIARTVADAVLMQSVIAGPDSRDPWSLGAPAFGDVTPELLGNTLDGTRIGFLTRAGNEAVGAEALAAARGTAAVLEGLGAAIEDVGEKIDWIEEEGRILYMGSIFAGYAKYLPEWKDRLDPILVGFIEQGRAVTLTQFRAAQAARSTLFRAVQTLFERYDLLLSPTLTRGALPVGFRPGFEDVEVDGIARGSTRQGWSSYMYPFNLTGHPAVTVPSGFDRDGLPLGTQIIGRWYRDADIMRVAAMIEAAAPWAAHRPPMAKGTRG
jgi:Asp-tRNA(Asn)/Glu-tRNA(Gln) amidotransferase A subunit family amidase